MKDLRYFPFTSTGTYTGQQGAAVSSTEAQGVSGSIAQPGDCLKLAYGETPWQQEQQTIQLLNGALQLSSLLEGDWTPISKRLWMRSYVRYCGTTELLTPAHLDALLLAAEAQGLFQQLSGSCVAYATKDAVTDVVSLGLGAYPLPFLRTYAATSPAQVQDIVARTHHPAPVLASNAALVTHRGITHPVWAFGGITHDYATATPCSLTTGGGASFAQVQLGGKQIRARYVIKARVDPADPTMGLVSGRSDRLYTGEELVLVDTSVWTQDVIGDWSWLGDFTDLPLRWYVADISNPGADYYGLPVDTLQFPVSALANVKIGGLG